MCSSDLKQGDKIEINGILDNIERQEFSVKIGGKEVLVTHNLGRKQVEIIRDGGLLNYIKKTLN